MLTRAETENWALRGRHVVDTTGEVTKVGVFWDSYIYCRKSDTSVSPWIVSQGVWEAWITTWFLNSITEFDTFIDVGMNSGYYSVLAGREGLEVVGFEPNPDYADSLAMTVRDNPWNITYHAVAVSDRDGTAELEVPGELEGGASIHERFKSDAFSNREFTHPVKTFEVKTSTMDAALGTERDLGRVLIKIDTEGAEEMVWNGSKAFTEKYRPTFVIEYTPNMYSQGFINSLDEYGLISWINYEGHEEPVPKDWADQQPDWVMLVIRPKESK